MANLNMSGPYVFVDTEMQAEVRDDKIGNYALGYENDNGSFLVKYVGRSDTDLRRRLIEHYNNRETYEFFKFKYAKSVEDTFIEECRNYHDFGESKSLDNERHPDRPDGKKYLTCPYCDIFDD